MTDHIYVGHKLVESKPRTELRNFCYLTGVASQANGRDPKLECKLREV